jgi:hypothetical protein
VAPAETSGFAGNNKSDKLSCTIWERMMFDLQLVQVTALEAI